MNTVHVWFGWWLLSVIAWLFIAGFEMQRLKASGKSEEVVRSEGIKTWFAGSFLTAVLMLAVKLIWFYA